jgi:signal transduction histidine kinase
MSWWFRALSALAMIGVIVSFMQFRIRNEVAQERLRLQIASDLHDDIGSSLSSIALVTDNIRKSLDETNPGRRQLHAVSAVAREAADRLKDDVWIVNPGTDTLGDLLLRMKDATKTILGQVPYSFHTEAFHGQRKLDMGFRKHFLLIYKEALHNVLKHAAAQHVEIAVHIAEDTLQLDIADNGKGFDPDSASGGNGLLNMRRRAAAVNGSLQIDSTPGCGTRVRLRARIP